MTDEDSAVAQYLARLAAVHDNALTAELVVADAARPDSPIHDRFTWDDTEAARQYRLVEARQLLRHVTVLVQDESVNGGNTMRVRQFEHAGDAYRPTQDALAKPEWRDEILHRLSTDVRLLGARYKIYRGLSAALDAKLALLETASA